MCENETSPARLKVKEEFFISGNFQAQEMSRKIVVCRGSLCSTRDHPFFMVLNTLIRGGGGRGTQGTPTTLT